MQGKSYDKFIGVILGNSMGNELYPLTKNYPLGALSVANKKLIAYQLEQLESISQLCSVVIVYSPDSIKVKQYLQSQFCPSHPNYPHNIQYFRVQNNTSQYNSIRNLLQSQLCDSFETAKGLIIAPLDLISSVKYSSIMVEHVEKDSDVTMLLKQKKQYAKDQKKPEYQIQSNIDILMADANNGRVYALRSIQSYEFSGFSMNKSAYSSVVRAKMEKVLDTRVYILSSRIIKILKHLVNDQLSHLKADFIDLLVRNQSNSTLLDFITQKQTKPLQIFCKVVGQNQYIRRIDNIKIYEALNLDALIRGPKQKQITMPNKYSTPIDQTKMSQFRGCVIGTHCQIDVNTKLTRNMIQNGCKIGKNVDISNSVIMAGTTIQDGCKINNCIIGPNCNIKSQATLSQCQLAMGCIVEKGTANQKQIMIPLQ